MQAGTDQQARCLCAAELTCDPAIAAAATAACPCNCAPGQPTLCATCCKQTCKQVTGAAMVLCRGVEESFFVMMLADRGCDLQYPLPLSQLLNTHLLCLAVRCRLAGCSLCCQLHGPTDCSSTPLHSTVHYGTLPLQGVFILVEPRGWIAARCPTLLGQQRPNCRSAACLACVWHVLS